LDILSTTQTTNQPNNERKPEQTTEKKKKKTRINRRPKQTTENIKIRATPSAERKSTSLVKLNYFCVQNTKLNEPSDQKVAKGGDMALRVGRVPLVYLAFP
jgi:hypothetical protein